MPETDLEMIGATSGDKRRRVMIDCDEGSVGEFVLSLLGRPQTISRSHYGTVDVGKDFFIGLNSLIIDRLRQQNVIDMVKLEVAIVFNDGSVRHLNSLDEFIAFAEVRPIISVGVMMTWKALIQFPSKSKPEIQEIRVTVTDKCSTDDSGMYQLMFGMPLVRKNGVMFIEVDHTERTWGDDIEGMISNYVKHNISITSKFKRNITEHGIIYGIFTSTILYLIFSYIYKLKGADLSTTLLRTTATPDVAEKINALVNIGAAYLSWTSAQSAFEILSILLSTISAFSAISIIGHIKRSFVSVTPFAETFRSKEKERENKRMLYFILSFISSISAGIAANYLSKFLIG